MELNITRFFREAAFMDYSASVAEIGADAGPSTWRAACDDASDYPELLPTEEAREAFRDMVRSSGGWDDEEIRAWSDDELTALLLQWISGDAREAFPHATTGDDLTAEDWAEYYAMAQEGQCSSRLFRTDDGAVYFTVE